MSLISQIELIKKIHILMIQSESIKTNRPQQQDEGQQFQRQISQFNISPRQFNLNSIHRAQISTCNARQNGIILLFQYASSYCFTPFSLSNIINLSQRAKMTQKHFRIKQIQSKLPLQLPITFQSSNKTFSIETYLYQNNITRQMRRMFEIQRQQYLDAHRNFKSSHLAKYNVILNEKVGKQGQSQNQHQWARLEQIYSLSYAASQLQFCIIVPSFNNAAKFRIQHNLNSIFTQNYSNYKVIIIDDASTDDSLSLYIKYFQFYNIPSHRFVLLHNQETLGALQNLYKSSLLYCSKESIVIHIDGDDQLIGRNVFKMFNWAYQTKQANVVYSNYYLYNQPTKIVAGFSSRRHYSQQEIKNNQFRDVKMKFSHLRSYRNFLTFKIREKDLKDKDNKFYKYAADLAIFFPVMEMACSKIYQITDQFHYLYNGNTGLNDGNNRQKQLQIEYELRCKPRYSCHNQTSN